MIIIVIIILTLFLILGCGIKTVVLIPNVMNEIIMMKSIYFFILSKKIILKIKDEYLYPHRIMIKFKILAY